MMASLLNPAARLLGQLLFVTLALRQIDDGGLIE